MEFDTLLKNGKVVDGGGQNPGFTADVGIIDGKIDAIGNLPDASAENVIDATGQVVAPGFIDVHLHSEIALLDRSNPLRFGALKQGVTTHLLAPDGFGWTHLDEQRRSEMWQYTLFSHGVADLGGPWPSAESYLSLFEGTSPANVVPQVPHLPIRLSVMGWDARPATDAELDAMKPLVQEWLDAGAVAFNTGLDYQPAAYADTRELIELSQLASGEGAIYAAHIRYGDLGKAGAWQETFQIAREAGVPVHISHEHVDAVTTPLLEEAATSCDLTFESYMYPAGCTHLAMMLPTWAQAGGAEAVLDRVRDEKTRKILGEALQDRLTGDKAPKDLTVAVNQTGRWIGQSFFQVAESESMNAGDLALKMIEEEHPYALMVFHQRVEGPALDNRIRATIQHPHMMVASDGVYHGAFGHPRSNGCFARALRLCVREMGAVSLEQAVFKMSGFPAERFRIPARGLLREGFAADVVIFDPNTVADLATWEEPQLDPIGISKVMVNGEIVVDAGVPTNATPGRVLRRQDYRSAA